MPKAVVGLLPLYLELYDRAMPEARPRVEAFYATIADQLRARDIEVVTTPLCRLGAEFVAAVRSFEQATPGGAPPADAIVTLHLAYSPSLESVNALLATRLPLIVLDTTPAQSFGPEDDPAELMYNHGIHGVQDLCNLLLRRGKPVQIEAGHWQRSDVLERVAAWARAARLATKMRAARVGRIGEPFHGMGDFAVPAPVLRATVGVDTVQCEPAALASLLPEAGAPPIESEIAADVARFDTSGLDTAAHRRSARAALAVRRWIERERLTAFTFNFLAITQASGLPTAPFLEASKAMARGIGYAGEGDVLTAALVGALASAYPDTTFTEIFCPDWAGERIFLSHMGEVNLELVEKPRLKEMEFPWTDADNPVFAAGRLRAGTAVLVNLAPARDDAYRLLIAPVTMLDAAGRDNMADIVHGWLRPARPIAEFLAAFSRFGGTHHSALVYGDVADDIARFGKIMGWQVIMLAARDR
jgi:L-arabinose isomerase